MYAFPLLVALGCTGPHHTVVATVEPTAAERVDLSWDAWYQGPPLEPVDDHHQAAIDFIRRAHEAITTDADAFWRPPGVECDLDWASLARLDADAQQVEDLNERLGSALIGTRVSTPKGSVLSRACPATERDLLPDLGQARSPHNAIPTSGFWTSYDRLLAVGWSPTGGGMIKTVTKTRVRELHLVGDTASPFTYVHAIGTEDIASETINGDAAPESNLEDMSLYGRDRVMVMFRSGDPLATVDGQLETLAITFYPLKPAHHVDTSLTLRQSNGSRKNVIYKGSHIANVAWARADGTPHGPFINYRLDGRPAATACLVDGEIAVLDTCPRPDR